MKWLLTFEFWALGYLLTLPWLSEYRESFTLISLTALALFVCVFLLTLLIVFIEWLRENTLRTTKLSQYFFTTVLDCFMVYLSVGAGVVLFIDWLYLYHAEDSLNIFLSIMVGALCASSVKIWDFTSSFIRKVAKRVRYS